MMNNPCEYYEELCSAAIDHALTPAEQKELDAHLAACPSCRAYLEELREMQKLWKELEVPMPTALHEKIMGEIEAEVQKTIVQTPAKPHRRPPVFTMLAAAAACVMLAVSGNLTGLFGQLGTTNSIPTEPSTTQSPSTAEGLPDTAQQSEEKDVQAKLQEQVPQTEQTLVPDESAQQSEQPVQNESQPTADVPQTADTPAEPQTEDTPATAAANQVPEAQAPSTQSGAATPRVASQAPEQSDSAAQEQTASPRVAMYSVSANLPQELKDMSFAKCFSVTPDEQHTDAALPVISGMTLLIEEDGTAYYSVENNESKITEVRQELEKNGYQTTLNESLGITFTLEAKNVLFIVE